MQYIIYDGRISVIRGSRATLTAHRVLTAKRNYLRSSVYTVAAEMYISPTYIINNLLYSTCAGGGDLR